MNEPDINWVLLTELRDKPHKLMNISTDLRGLPDAWIGEVFQEARTAHHLLDLIGVPEGRGYNSDLDARTYLAVVDVQALRERLGRISAWHSREEERGGLVGDFCVMCGEKWPCETRMMADGTYGELGEEESDVTG